MTKKHDTATALASIITAKRGDDRPATPAIAIHAEPQAEALPSPPLPPVSRRVRPAKEETPVLKGNGGKSSNPNYRQCSLYLTKVLRKKAGRAWDDEQTGKDFSDLVEMLLEKWLASRT